MLAGKESHMTDVAPYFDELLRRLDAGDPVTRAAYGRHVHWGYWPDPDAATAAADDYAAAAERLCRLVCDAAVALIDNPDNVDNVYASKAVGEPPLLLAVSVWAAVKQALASAAPGREGSQSSKWPICRTRRPADAPSSLSGRQRQSRAQR